MDASTVPRKLWEHHDPKGTAMWRFMQESNRRYGLSLNTFQDMYTWSCKHRSDFYGQLWESLNYHQEGSYTRVVDESAPISSLPKWFEGVKVNMAENFLWSRDPATGAHTTANKEDGTIAVTEVREGNTEVKNLTWDELRRRVEEMASAMAARGVGEGDRVVVVGAHCVSTMIVMLATLWLGGVFSSSSTDMGVGGLLQRTVQIDPKFVFFDDGALYNGKIVDLRDKIAGVAEGMKDCPNFHSIVAIQRFDKAYDTSAIARTERLEAFLAPQVSKAPIRRVGFQDPSVIYFSSGTTGTPKAIVHGTGTLLISLGKESLLHRDIAPEDVGLQYTTTGWIMYLAAVAHLLFAKRAVFYDGSPFMNDIKVLVRVVAEQKVTHLGTSPRWMGELMKNNVVPRTEFDLSSLKGVVCTGMVLSEQLFEWFYDVAFPKRAHLCNISGGTDIAGCFAMDNPLTPVYVGGCQGPALGTPMAVYDHDLPEGSPDAKPLPAGTPGDLVSPAAFPNVPIYLWNDGPVSSAPGPKYKSAYFSRYDKAWAQGDFCAVHPVTGSIVMLGRSDGVLNPSGVRFGSADIYAVVERHFGGEVAESICVGQRREKDLDERVVLFLLMRPGVKLDKGLVGRMREKIAGELTKRHVPRYIFEVPEIPVTVNGKKVELPVKHIISGSTVKPSGTLLNPQSLDFFYRFQEVEKLTEPQAKL